MQNDYDITPKISVFAFIWGAVMVGAALACYLIIKWPLWFGFGLLALFMISFISEYRSSNDDRF